jgi:hypothetical protein
MTAPRFDDKMTRVMSPGALDERPSRKAIPTY